jgi:hypothetical protein
MKHIKKLNMVFLTVVFSILLKPLDAMSQSQSIEIGAFGGGDYILGDTLSSFPFVNGGAAFGGLVRYNHNTRWTFKGSVYHGKYSINNGTNRDTPNRLGLTDVSLLAEFNFFDYETGSSYYVFTPYLFMGPSLLFFKDEEDNLVTSGALAFGLGIKYSLTKKLGLAFEWGMRKTFTDMLDYYDPSPSGNDEPSGNFWAGYDWYNFTGITLTYKFDLYNSKSCYNH